MLGQTWGGGRDGGPGMLQSMELQRVGIKGNSLGFSYVLKFCHSYQNTPRNEIPWSLPSGGD